MARNELGKTLIEVVFVISIAVLILGGLVKSLSFFNRIQKESVNRSEALNLAQSRLEFLKAEKEANDSFWSNIDNYSGNEDLGKFTRVTSLDYDFTETPAPNRRVLVTVTVSWETGKGTKQVELSRYLTEY